MNKSLVLTCIAMSALAAASAAPAYQMRSYATAKGQTQPVFAWCDSPRRVLALTKVNSGQTPLYHWAKSKSGLGSLSVSTVKAGKADPGAGQTDYALNVVNGSRNGQSGFLHVSNIENVKDPAYRMTRINEFKLGGDLFRCRYVPNAAFMGATAKRTVIIWDAGDVISYATRNFDGSAGVYLTDGRRRTSVEGGLLYEFTSKDGFIYHVNVDEYGPGTGAKVGVSKGGSVRLSEPFNAYSVSQPLR